MFGENGQVVDLGEVREAISQADVLVVGFRDFPERLIVDSRRTEAVGPMARVVEPLSGVEERMHWLGRTRPQFGLPQRFTFFVWPHSAPFLEETGVTETAFETIGSGHGAEQLRGALDELYRLQRVAHRAAVNGDQWRTLWDAQGSRHGG